MEEPTIHTVSREEWWGMEPEEKIEMAKKARAFIAKAHGQQQQISFLSMGPELIKGYLSPVHTSRLRGAVKHPAPAGVGVAAKNLETQW